MGTPPPAGLMAAFWRYEAALMSDDLDALGELTAATDDVLRADDDGVLTGPDPVRAVQERRRGAPTRTVVGTHVHVIDDDHAHVLAETRLHRGGRAIQGQLWQRIDGAWRVLAEHTSSSEAAFDRRTWRVLGDPLVRATATGPLTGHTVAVKDVFAVAGQVIGAGNPTWTARSALEPGHAWAVEALLRAGAHVKGITRCEEFGFGLTGENAHYGTPPNPRAPGRVPGGSSSGSAAAVALGHVSIGLGSDTGGSIRVPAAYQGLWGVRTTPGAVPRDGMLPLAPSFDTVGWLTRDPDTLAQVGRALLPSPEPGGAAAGIVLVEDLLGPCSPDVADAVERFAKTHGAAATRWDADLDRWRELFTTRQRIEAWATHAWWLAEHLDTLGDAVRRRFEAAAAQDTDAPAASMDALWQARDEIRDRIGDQILLLPAAPTVAPLAGAAAGDELRSATLTVTSVAGVGGLPAVTVPLTTADGIPCGATLVGAPGRDRDLLELAITLDRAEPGARADR